eukprot:9023668-Pyramimonas_sp.AAC.1
MAFAAFTRAREARERTERLTANNHCTCCPGEVRRQLGQPMLDSAPSPAHQTGGLLDHHRDIRLARAVLTNQLVEHNGA